MSHSSSFEALRRALGLAKLCEQRGLSTDEGRDRLQAALQKRLAGRISRRNFLAIAATSTIGTIGLSHRSSAWAAPKPAPSIRVAIVGAGLAGLSCGYELKKQGIHATLFEAGDRPGGRCASLRGLFPQQVAEQGGEFIDNLHKTMLGYAKEFGLALEDLSKEPGEITYFFNQQRYDESIIVDEFRQLVAAMRDDLRTLSGAPSADLFNAADALLDNTSLSDYLDSRGAGSLAKAAIEEAYLAEYGLEPSTQSALNFLLFIHADRRSKFTPFGVFSDERYHVVEGNDKIIQGLRDRLPNQIRYGTRLIRLRKTSLNQLELTFHSGSGSASRSEVFDAVVLAIPFTTLRQVELDASLELPPWKLKAIQELGYGTNAKQMIGFQSRPWAALNSNGSSYSDLSHHQATWETNPSRASVDRAILTDYASGDRGLALNPRQSQTEASRFLRDLERVYPGAFAAARRDRTGNFVQSYLAHWPSNPLSLGSYTCYTPGQFTTLAGNEGKPIGNLHFAGEHANSFYEWQGFMEGAALSGIQAAREILQKLKVGAL